MLLPSRFDSVGGSLGCGVTRSSLHHPDSRPVIRSTPNTQRYDEEKAIKAILCDHLVPSHAWFGGLSELRRQWTVGLHGFLSWWESEAPSDEAAVAAAATCRPWRLRFRIEYNFEYTIV